MNVEKLNIQINADAKSFQNTINAVQKSLDNLTTDVRKTMGDINTYIAKNFGKVKVKNILDSKNVKDMMLPIEGLSGSLRMVTEQINEATGMIMILQQHVKEFKDVGFDSGSLDTLYEKLGQIQTVQEQLIEQRNAMLSGTTVSEIKVEGNPQELANDYKNSFEQAVEAIQRLIGVNISTLEQQLASVSSEIDQVANNLAEEEAAYRKAQIENGDYMSPKGSTIPKDLAEWAIATRMAGEVNETLVPLLEKEEELKGVIESQKKALEDNNEKLKTRADIYNELKKSIADLQGKKVDLTPEGKEELEQSEALLKRIKSEASSDVFKNIGGEFSKMMQNNTGKLGEMLAPLSDIGVNVSQVTTVIGVIIEAAKTVQKIIQKIDSAVETTVSTALKGAEMIGRSVAAFWTTIVTGTKNFTSLLGTVIQKVDVLGNTFEKLESFFKRLSRLISRVFVFTVFTKFFRALRSEITAYLQASAELQNELAQLKGAWLTAFTPIYEAVLPIVQTLVHWITILGQKFAQLISIFTGKSVKSMGESAKALYENAHAAEAAGGAAEEAKKQLMGFDQLNVLQDNSGGGGGAGASSSAPDFSWVEDAEQFENFGDWLFAFFDDLVAKLPDINKALDNAAQAINNFFKELDEGFARPDVINKAIEFFSGLADALNNFVNKVDFSLIGKTIGDGLNLILKSLNAFIDEFDWQNLGVKLGEGFNGLINSLDFAELGKFLVQKFNMIFETLAGLFTTIDWATLGQKLAQGINSMVANINLEAFVTAFNAFVRGVLTAANELVTNFDISGFVDQLNKLGKIDIEGILTDLVTLINSVASKTLELFSKIDFGAIATNLATGISNAVKQLDAASLGQIIAELFNSAIDFALNFLTSYDWKGLATKLADFINGAFQNIDYNNIGLTLGTMLQKAVSTLADFIIRIKWSDIATKVANGINTALKSIDGKKMATELNGIANSILTGIQTFLKELDWNEIKSTISELLSRIDWLHIIDSYLSIKNQIRQAFFQTFMTAVESIDWVQVTAGLLTGLLDLVANVTIDIVRIGADIAAGLLEGIAGVFVGIYVWLADHVVKPIINGIKQLFDIHSPSKVMEGIGKNVGLGLLEGIKKAVDSILNFLKTFASQVIDTIVKAFEGAKSKIVEVWNGIGSALNQKWNAIRQDCANAFNNVKTSIASSWESLRTTAATTFQNINTTINSTWDKVKTNSLQRWDNIRSSLTTTWTNLNTQATLKFNQMKESITNVNNNIKTAVEAKWNEVKTKVSTITDNLKTTVSNNWNTLKSNVATANANIASDVNSKWADIRSKISTAWDEINSKTRIITDNVKSQVTTTFENIKSNVSTAMGNLKENLNTTFANIKSSISTSATEAKSAVVTQFNEIKTQSANIWNNIKTSTVNLANSMSQGVKNAFSGLSTTVSNLLSNVFSTIGSWKDKIGSTISDMVSNASATISNFSSSVSNTLGNIKSTASSVASSVSNAVSSATTPKSSPVVTGYTYSQGHKYAVYSDGTRKMLYASGGVVTRPTSAIVGEYANAANNPEIITPENKMREVFKEVLNNDTTPEMLNNILAAITRNTKAIETKNTDVYLDKQKVTKTITQEQKRQSKLFTSII